MSSNLIKSFNLLRLETLCNLDESNDGVNDVNDTWTRISSFFDHVGFVDEFLAFIRVYWHLIFLSGYRQLLIGKMMELKLVSGQRCAYGLLL